MIRFVMLMKTSQNSATRFLLIFASLVLSLVASARAPVVGIAEICGAEGKTAAPSAYSDAVYAAGAVPYLLPSTTNATFLSALVDGIDMLLLCGGEDVDPRRYGETNGAGKSRTNLRRDVWELALMDEVIRRRKPILGVCRGCQILNVRFGGTLWQDIPTEVAGASSHRQKGNHLMKVERGVFLEKMLGSGTVLVNSLHHQAVRQVAAGFRVAAVSQDGVIEAIEGVDYPAYGVQFHPEKLLVTFGRREFLPLFRGAFANLGR